MIHGQRLRNRLRLLAGAFASAAQFVLAGAPFAEARSGPDASAHVEQAGTSLHHAHDEATCIACVSQHLLSGAEPARPANPVSVAAASLPRTIVRDADSRVPQFFTNPRAPPVSPV
ncbi:MAG TPA: hypothetical protein VNC11_01550 [Gemmatimonadaceae bacterium]|nr:hypothetical protein [Gemmatimonadaceae bacterium]